MLSKIMDFGEATISRYESNPYKTNHMIICCVAITELVYAHHDMGVFVFCVASDNSWHLPRKKSNRIFRTKHFSLMRKFRTRSRPTLNDRNRLFQA